MRPSHILAHVFPMVMPMVKTMAIVVWMMRRLVLDAVQCDLAGRRQLRDGSLDLAAGRCWRGGRSRVRDSPRTVMEIRVCHGARAC